jgi:AcrR family transcriptional regulator
VATSEQAGSEEAVPHRRPGRPRDAHRDKAILSAVLEILNVDGYAGLTIEGVAARARVGRPTIYRRWASKPELVVAALAESVPIAVPDVDTGSLRSDLVAMQRRQVALMNSPESRRITAGLVADLATDRDLGHMYVSEYLMPRRAVVFRVLQRAIDRGELAPDADLSFVHDLLVGPLFMRAVVWGEPLADDAAEKTTDVILAAFPPARKSD